MYLLNILSTLIMDVGTGIAIVDLTAKILLALKKYASSVKDADTERARLFRLANARHVQYAAWAADGQGVDRHLFGLKRMLKEGEELPEIYNDKAFSQTNHWELSTSQLSSDYIDGWGYGEGASRRGLLRADC